MTDNGLPRVEGLDAIIAESLAVEDKGQAAAPDMPVDPAVVPQQDAPVADGQAPSGMSDEEILAQFKSTKDLLKSYKEIQGFTTRISQENKEKAKVIDELNARLNSLQEEAELRRYQTQAPKPPVQNRSFEELFIENPEAAITSKAMEIANVQRINEVLEDKKNENPKEWQERIAYVHMLSQQPEYEPLSHSPKGVQRLFDIADKTRATNLQENAYKTLKVLFGDDFDLEKVKALVRGGSTPTTNQPTPVNPLHAYMPNTGTSIRTGQDIDTNVNDLERIKRDAVATGDADTVAGAILRQALLK